MESLVLEAEPRIQSTRSRKPRSARGLLLKPPRWNSSKQRFSLSDRLQRSSSLLPRALTKAG